jgi:hypothetical protein
MAIRSLSLALTSSLRGAAFVAAALSLAVGAAPGFAYDWPQFNGDAAHSGNNTFEALLGSANVAQLAPLYHVTLPALAEGAPAYLQGVTTASGVKDLLFVTTRAGDILALDAANGAVVWSRSYPFTSQNCLSWKPPCGTTSSPAIDPDRRYVYTYGLDGKARKLQVGDGVEVQVGGWPQTVTLKTDQENVSSALAIARAGGATYLYVPTSGYYGDAGDYQGHVTAINLGTGAQSVFNMLCSDQAAHLVAAPGSPNCASRGAGVWARPGVVYDAGTNRIFMTGGNQFSPGPNNWGDSVVALRPDATGVAGQPLDAYIPANRADLDAGDIDLGSTAIAVLPAPAGSSVAHLGVQGGKDGKLRLINLANMNGSGGAGPAGGEVGTIIGIPQGGVLLTQPAVWINPADGSTWVFVANSAGISALRVALDAGGNPSLAVQWQKGSGSGGTSPLVANNVLYYASNSGGLLRALDPATGNVLFSSTSLGAVRWHSPVVADCSVYVLDTGAQLTRFSLPAAIAAQPARLAVTANGGQDVTAGSAFNVVVQAQDCNGVTRNVGTSTAVALSVAFGSGTLGGATGCTIAAGSSSCTASGVTYSQLDSSVVLAATRTSGVSLSRGASRPFTSTGTSAGCTLDIDGNAVTDALTDGIMILRTMFGLTGAAVTDGAIGPNATRTSWAQVQPLLTSGALDVDGNGRVDALTDGLLVLRAMFGLTGASVTIDAVGSGATRTDWPAVRSYLNGTCGASFPAG